jgi:hypothetical protein
MISAFRVYEVQIPISSHPVQIIGDSAPLLPIVEEVTAHMAICGLPLNKCVKSRISRFDKSYVSKSLFGFGEHASTLVWLSLLSARYRMHVGLNQKAGPTEERKQCNGTGRPRMNAARLEDACLWHPDEPVGAATSFINNDYPNAIRKDLRGPHGQQPGFTVRKHSRSVDVARCEFRLG